jgi:hypothetical protein
MKRPTIGVYTLLHLAAGEGNFTRECYSKAAAKLCNELCNEQCDDTFVYAFAQFNSNYVMNNVITRLLMLLHNSIAIV